MARVRLLGWLMVVGGASFALLRDLRWSGDPPTAAMAVVRGVAGMLAAYLAVATLAELARLPLPTPAFVRGLVAAAVGGSLLATPMTSAAEPRPRPPADAPVLHRLDDPAPAPTPPPPAPDTNFVELPSATDGNSTKFVTIQAGDHLWAVAEREVAARIGRTPTDDEVAGYWRQVVDANRTTLRSGDPDLVFPGEQVRLPS